MELLILCAWYMIIRGVRDTVGNTAALLQGRPVQVRHPHGVTTTSAGGGTAVAPNYTGRAVGTVGVVAKESLVSGVLAGRDYGKARYQARVERRATKKATKAAAGGVGEAPELATTDAPEEPATPEGAAAPKTPGEAPNLDTNPAGDDKKRETERSAAAVDALLAPLSEAAASRSSEGARQGTTTAAGPADAGGGPTPGPEVPGAERALATTPTSERAPVDEAQILAQSLEVSRAEMLARSVAARAVGDADTTPAAGSGPTEQPDPVEGGATVLYMAGRRPQDDRSGGGDDEEPRSTGSEQSAQDGNDEGGIPTMTTMTGETTTIDATRTYFGQLVEHVQNQILSQLELCQATLTGAEMDPTTLGHVSVAMEHFATAQAEITAALDTLNSKHGLMEEAVNTTDHAAQRDYYRHQ